jgi:hypothetical protein
MIKSGIKGNSRIWVFIGSIFLIFFCCLSSCSPVRTGVFQANYIHSAPLINIYDTAGQFRWSGSILSQVVAGKAGYSFSDKFALNLSLNQTYRNAAVWELGLQRYYQAPNRVFYQWEGGYAYGFNKSSSYRKYGFVLDWWYNRFEDDLKFHKLFFQGTRFVKTNRGGLHKTYASLKASVNYFPYYHTKHEF